MDATIGVDTPGTKVDTDEAESDMLDELEDSVTDEIDDEDAEIIVETSAELEDSSIKGTAGEGAGPLLVLDDLEKLMTAESEETCSEAVVGMVFWSDAFVVNVI